MDNIKNESLIIKGKVKIHVQFNKLIIIKLNYIPLSNKIIIIKING